MLFVPYESGGLRANSRQRGFFPNFYDKWSARGREGTGRGGAREEEKVYGTFLPRVFAFRVCNFHSRNFRLSLFHWFLSRDLDFPAFYHVVSNVSRIINS